MKRHIVKTLLPTPFIYPPSSQLQVKLVSFEDVLRTMETTLTKGHFNAICWKLQEAIDPLK